MSPWLQFTLGACALLLTALQLAGKGGWWAGKQEGTRAADAAALGALAIETMNLRAWRHKVGEDPCDALGKLVDLHVANFERRVTRLEVKVFNGSR